MKCPWLRPSYRCYDEYSQELELAGLEHQESLGALQLKDASHLEQIVRGHVIVNAEKIAASPDPMMRLPADPIPLIAALVAECSISGADSRLDHERVSDLLSAVQEQA